MTAIINNVIVQGKPEEIKELINLQNEPKYDSGNPFVTTETTYDRQIRELNLTVDNWQCPPILHEGVARYQMTCDDCPTHVRSMCKESRIKKDKL